MTDTTSKPGLVNWIGYLAICFFVTIPLAVLTVRAGAWEQGLLLYALSCLGSVVILLLAVLVSFLSFPSAKAKVRLFSRRMKIGRSRRETNGYLPRFSTTMAQAPGKLYSTKPFLASLAQTRLTDLPFGRLW